MKGVEIQLDKLRLLHFDTNALIEVEEATGWGVEEISKRMQNRPSLKLIRAVLWAGLLTEDPTLTLKQVGSFTTPKNYGEVWTKVVEALNKWMEADSSPSPLADSPGANSGPSLVTT